MIVESEKYPAGKTFAGYLSYGSSKEHEDMQSSFVDGRDRSGSKTGLL